MAPEWWSRAEGAVVDSGSDSARPDHHAMSSRLGDSLYWHLPGRQREEPAVANYVQLGDVYTYYEEDGQGEPLVLLHPGGADSWVFESNLAGLTEDFHVFRPDRRGHGRTADVEVRFPTR